MSTDRDVTRTVRSWLEEGATRLPDRVLDTVLYQLPATHQRRAIWWPARRVPFMNSNMFRVAVAGAAVVVLAVVGLRFLPGSGNSGGPPDPTATPISTVEPTATPIPQLGPGPLPPGRYRVDPLLPVEVTVDVSAGWTTDVNWVVIGPKGNAEPDGMAIRFYTASHLYVDPLHVVDGVLDPPVGPSVEDLVAAMVDHPDWTTTGPEAITLDGYAGQVVHVTLPPGTSDASPFYLSIDQRGDQHWGWAAGQVFDIYVIDVDGERLVIDAFHFPGTSAEDLTAQRAVIESIQFAP